MRALKWNTSHAVFVTEIDDDHKEIFEAVSSLQSALARAAPTGEIESLTQHLTTTITGHFAHEERLMRAARYPALRWHKQLHETASKRLNHLAAAIHRGDPNAVRDLVRYLAPWLVNHAGIADRMMGAFLRNHQRCVWKLTFEAGTRPRDACTWVNTRGETFRPVSGANHL